MTVRLASIQLLRAVAALFVVVVHQAGALARLGAPNATFDLSFGTFGVDLFFVISGFIMVYSSEELFGRPGALREFAGRRLLRIVPLYWGLTTLLIVIWVGWFGWFGEKLPELMTWKLILGSYFFVPVPRPHNGEILPLLSVGWTLNYEMFFYCLFAAALFLRRNAATLILSAAIFAISALPFEQAPMSVWSSGLICEFAFGMWIAILYRAGWRVSPLISGAMIVSGFVIAIGTYMEIIAVPRVAGWGMAATLIVLAATICRTNLEGRHWLLPLIALGDASYALYLVHPFIPSALKALRVVSIFEPSRHALLFSVISVCASIGAAFLLNAFDKKAQAHIRGRLGRARSVPASN